MPDFSFKGFTTGSIVALSAALGGVSDSASVQSWGQPNLANLNIQTRVSSSRVAPAGVWFEATDITGFDVGGPVGGEIYDPSFHEITYIWTVRNRPLQVYTAPENLVAGWNDPNVAYGKKVAFLFPDPGVYTVDLWAVDSQGTTGAAEIDIVVTDPDTVYPGTRTICFSDDPGETWSGEKAGCARVTSLPALASALNDNVEKRVLFKRGSTVQGSGVSVMVEISGNRRPAYIGAWGTGANPRLLPPPRGEAIRIQNSGSDNLSELVIDSIDFIGSWDAATETGYPSDTPLQLLSQSQHLHLTISDTTFDGFSAVWASVGTGHSGTTIIANTVCTNWRDYGYFVHPSNFDDTVLAIIGSRVAQHVDALNGGPKNGFYNTHGPVRYADLSDTYFGITDFFSRNGWSSLPPDTGDQPCIRVNTAVRANRSMNMDRSVCEGGFQIIALEGANGSNDELPGNYLFDKCLLMATAKSIMLAKIEFGGTTMRNVIGIVPNVPLYHFWAAGVFFAVDNTITDNLNAPLAVYNSSFLNLRDAANDQNDDWEMTENPAGFTTVTVENNILHGPDLDTPVTPDAPIDLTQALAGVTPRYRGVLFNPFGEESGSATVSDGASFTRAYPAGTDQAYWQALPASDSRHVIVFGNDDYYADLGEISVSFEASAIRITNLSGESWSGSYILKLDRKSQLPAIPSAAASPATVPRPVPSAGSAALGGSGLGYFAYDDFFGSERITPVGGAILV